ncbi:MAG: serine/threonine protein kinase [Polyangiaceae bacterium]|nr:serine/threonine protein kinase [Polyangiaceae bacterium]
MKAGLIIVDKYRLEMPLGRGAMGAVWAATHLGLGELVALKFIHAPYAASPQARYRFETEARATAKIRSRFVVSVFDTGQLADGTLYLVMERLQGETLHAYVKRRGALPLDEAVGYACHVGRALGHAHALGVVHRDIKPSNIFLADTPDDGRIAKVLDFGVAKLSCPLEGWAPGQTGAGALLGTPQYMSPEQARGQGAVDHRADIYSLGLVFYRMYTGRASRTAGPVGDLIARILTEPLPRLGDIRADAPPALNAWFARACAANPNDRFESVGACIEALVEASGLCDARFVESPGRAPGPTGRLRGPEIAELRAQSLGRSFGPLGAVPVSSDASNDGGFVRGGSVLPPGRGTEGRSWPWTRRPTLSWALGVFTTAVAFASLGALLSHLGAEASGVEGEARAEHHGPAVSTTAPPSTPRAGGPRPRVAPRRGAARCPRAGPPCRPKAGSPRRPRRRLRWSRAPTASPRWPRRAKSRARPRCRRRRRVPALRRGRRLGPRQRAPSRRSISGTSITTVLARECWETLHFSPAVASRNQGPERAPAG